MLALLGLVLAAVVLGVHPGTMFLDTRPDLYLRPGRLFDETLSTWARGTGLGAPNYDNGYLPPAAVLSFLNLAGLPPWLAMRVWRLLMYVAAGLGARALYLDLHRTHRRPPYWGSNVVVAVVYVVNPFVLVGADSTPVMLCYALLPWLLLTLRRGFRPRWWVGTCGFGVTFFLMGGLNAGVIPLMMLLAVPLVAFDAWWREDVRIRVILRAIVGCAIATVLVSLYWIVGTVIAFGTASAVATSTEDPRVIAATSSFAEVMRGQGSWLQYGADSLGAYNKDYLAYVTFWLVIIATFLLSVLALWGVSASRSKIRGVAMMLTLLGLVIMVGANPPQHPSPFGRALLWAFDHHSITLAFRTTNKAGPIAFLGMSLLFGLGFAAVWPRLNEVAKAWVAGTLVIATIVSVSPVVFGHLLVGKFGVPDYWQTAFNDLDTRASDGRLWMLPGETNAIYRWRERGVDDYAPSMLDRGVVYRRTYPDGPGASVNALAGVDDEIESGSATANLISTYARYLGASEVLVRNDMLWEIMSAARPLTIATATEGDSGLRISALIGAAGTNMTPSNLTNEQRPDESALPPLIRYAVTEPGSLVQAQPVAGEVLVSGDNAAVPAAVWDHVVDGSQPFRLTPQMTDAQIVAAAEQGDVILLTDTNRRHLPDDHRLNLSGPLLSPLSSAKNLRTLGKNISDQTRMSYLGIKSVTASTSGSVFGPTPNGRPFLAFDHQPTTSWQFGDFGSAMGNWIRADFLAPTRLTTVSISRPPATSGKRIASVDVSAGGEHAVATFVGDTATATFSQPVTAKSLEVSVRTVSGTGLNQVGISEIQVPGLRAAERVQMPTRITDLAQRSPALRAALASNPLAIVLMKSTLETESNFNRVFQTLSARTFTVRARVAEPNRINQWRTCKVIGNLDGRKISAKFVGKAPRRTFDTEGNRLPVPLELTGCNKVTLLAGQHTFASTPFVQVNKVAFNSKGLGIAPYATYIAPKTTWTRTSTSLRAHVTSSPRSSYLVVAESYDPRWVARIDGGKPVRPTLINGYALGWRLSGGRAHDVRISFTPQRTYERALIVSLGSVGLMLAALLAEAVLTGVRRRRSRGDR